mmetsp:Transcript_11461/g.36441  ORF Transcript_11461/g.36441 Transcript_11461/m.36441 type:complete len:106 (-) Transcript_11461:35-352(-)
MALSAKAATLAALLLALGATLQGCGGCEKDKAQACMDEYAKLIAVPGTYKEMCNHIDHTSRCIKDLGCCSHQAESNGTTFADKLHNITRRFTMMTAPCVPTRCID